MSIHKSLKSGSGLGRTRNVLTRAERVEKLQKEGVMKPGDPVVGLPKTKVASMKRGKGPVKKKEKEEKGKK